MSNFNPINAGGWAWEDPITPDQINLIQEDLMKCPNFTDGGNYSPTSPVIVGDSKIASAGIHVPNRIVHDVVQSAIVSASNGTVIYMDVTGCNVAFSDAKIGDIIEGVVFLGADASASGNGSIIVLTRDNANATIDPFVLPFHDNANRLQIPFRSVSPTNGTLSVIARIAGDGIGGHTATAYNFHPSTLHSIYCKLLRPTVE